MLELLLTAVLVALSAVGLTVIVRNAPVVRGWVAKSRKPWACNVCMPLYTCAAVVGGLVLLQHDLRLLLAYLPAYALANITLDHMGPLFIPPEMLEISEEKSEPPVTRDGF